MRIELVGRSLWRYRRWLFGVYMLVALARIPARTHYYLVVPACDRSLTLANAARSLSKTPHLLLFGLCCLLILLQFDRVDRRSVAWSVAFTTVVGLVVELEEGATRTGNCRLTDLLPDFVGAVAAAVLVVGILPRRIRDP